MMTTFRTEQFISHSPKETHRLARRLLKELPEQAVLGLHGELGSGKTCFVQGLAQALGICQPVTSPTFTLIHEYQGNRPLYHVDLYRIHSAQEAVMLGLDEYLERDGIVVIEWADRAEGILPPHTIHLDFAVGSARNERLITIRYGAPASGAATAKRSDAGS